MGHPIQPLRSLQFLWRQFLPSCCCLCVFSLCAFEIVLCCRLLAMLRGFEALCSLYAHRFCFPGWVLDTFAYLPCCWHPFSFGLSLVWARARSKHLSHFGAPRHMRWVWKTAKHKDRKIQKKMQQVWLKRIILSGCSPRSEGQLRSCTQKYSWARGFTSILCLLDALTCPDRSSYWFKLSSILKSARFCVHHTFANFLLFGYSESLWSNTQQ